MLLKKRIDSTLLLEKEEKLKGTSLQRIEAIKLVLLSCVQQEREMRIKKLEDRTYEEDMDGIIPKLKLLFFGRYKYRFEWEKFYCLLDESYGNALSKLFNKHPEIHPTQFKFCSLLLARFKTTEIAYILDVKPNTIRMKKISLRNLLGITDGGDISTYIASLAHEDIELKSILTEDCEFFKQQNHRPWSKK